jgi:hypothetical protein
MIKLVINLIIYVIMDVEVKSLALIRNCTVSEDEG